MKKTIADFYKTISLSIFFSVLSSAAIPLCIVAGERHTASLALQIIIPVVFWIGLILEQVCIWKANSMRKNIEKNTKLKKFKRRCGIISFWSTFPGKVTDVMMPLFALILIVMLITNFSKDYMQFIVISLLVLSFRLHCTFNGKNYRYKEYLVIRRATYE